MSGWDSLWININLATMDPARPHPYGMIENIACGDDAIAIARGRIAWLGKMTDLPSAESGAGQVIDGEGRWITPGLIDCHSHLVYGGNRATEFEERLQGVSYEEIARRGGGILSTVRDTRGASEQELYRSAAGRLQCFLAEGITGVEIKSGYGLERDCELRMLRVARQLGEEFPVSVSTTFLGAHTLAPEFDETDAYIDYLCSEVLPEVARQGLADAVDVFCESIAFDLPQSERLFRAAAELGLPVKMHAEQLSNSGGAALAAHHNALSADHLEYLDAVGIAAMRESGTVAVLLPGAFYFLGETRLPPVAALRDAGVAIAIASDANPGSSPVSSLLLMLNMACTQFRLTPEEALAGVTLHAARALGWEDDRGSLAVAKHADLAVWNIGHPAELAYRVGGNPCHQVLYRGETVHRNA